MLGRCHLIGRGRDVLDKVDYVAFLLSEEAGHEDGTKSNGEIRNLASHTP